MGFRVIVAAHASPGHLWICSENVKGDRLAATAFSMLISTERTVLPAGSDRGKLMAMYPSD
jgi:hypothetical protein